MGNFKITKSTVFKHSTKDTYQTSLQPQLRNAGYGSTRSLSTKICPKQSSFFSLGRYLRYIEDASKHWVKLVRIKN